MKQQNRHHPGAGRGRGRIRPKGRTVEPEARAEVAALLGDRPRRRDLLVEHLHLLQDHYRGLAPRHLAALAEAMRLSMAEVYETATFYAHFDVLAGDEQPADVTVRVCDGLPCELAGAPALCTALREAVGAHARVVPAPCMGRCDHAPAVAVGHRHVEDATVDAVMRTLDAGSLEPAMPSYRDLPEYESREGGYRVLSSCLAGERSFEAVTEELDAAGLRGLGGAGFPTGRKWRVVRGYAGPRLLAVNADEGEPGTFKDRHYLETDPHRFLEGVLIAAWAVEAKATYIYLRDEYPGIRALLLKELGRLEARGLAAHTRIELRRGAGAYICGEESAMIESLEGKRGLPRHRPPYVAERGLFGRPTLVQNVETLFWVRDILERGATWFADYGGEAGRGLRSYSVSGRVRRPGVKIAAAGITARELIDTQCGGMAEGHRFKAYLPGGASGGILPASMADLPLDFGTLEPHGCFVGSHAVVVLSDRDPIGPAARNLLRFFEDESCGQCTPCRAGTEKAVALMEQASWNEPLLRDLAAAMADASICGLGQAAPNPILSVLRHFRDEVGLGDE